MRVAELTGIRTIALSDRPEPALPPAHVRVRVDLVGLCGSDLSYFARGANGDFVVQAPLVLGHEIIGTVTGLGPEAGDGFRLGERVAVHPAWPAPAAGESAISPALIAEPRSFLGSASTWPHTDGGLQEVLCVDPGRLRRLPAGLPARTAVLAEPTAVVLHALARVEHALAGARVAISGAGPIGLLALVAAKRAGAASVIVTDVRAAALALARDLGADQTIDVSTASVPESAVDIAVEASGAVASVESAVRMTREGGAIVQLGMLPRDARPMALSGLVVKELHLVGSHRFGGELDAALALLASAPECARIVTTIRAFEAVADPDVVGKVIVDVSGSPSL